MTDILPRRPAFGTPAVRPSLAQLYHEQSKLHSAPGQHVTAVDAFSVAEITAMTRGHKRYRRATTVVLPEPPPSPSPTFDEVITRRRTVREFGATALPAVVLGAVLRQTYGVTGAMAGQGGHQHLRAAPSAGSLYPGELYLGIRTIEGISAGLYHYDPIGHQLELLTVGDHTGELCRVCCNQHAARVAAVVVFFAAVLERPQRKYGMRGYRYALLDIGHVAQNFALSCTAHDLAVMTTCGFFDDDANALFRLDGVDETIVYVGLFGPKTGTADPSVQTRQPSTFMRAEYEPLNRTKA